MHRLVVGDSTDQAVASKLMREEKADMCFTDPPYGVAVNTGSLKDLKARNRRLDGAVVDNDAMKPAEFKAFLLRAFGVMNSSMKDGGAAYICHAEALGMDVIFRTAFAESGFKPAEIIIWVKDVFVFGRQDYHWRHEPIIYGWKEGAAHYFSSDRTQDTVWEFPRPKKSENHPTIKPADLSIKAIQNSSRLGEIVFDGFVGSGTTLVACEVTGRRGRAIELAPKYAAVTLQRLADMELAPVLSE